MKPYSIPTVLFALLLSAATVSCDKDDTVFSSSVNNGNPPPPPAPPSQGNNNIYSNLSSVSSTDQVFYFFSSYTYPISCVNTYCTGRSRYILRNDGSFLLQYSYDGANEYQRGIQYKGRYTQTNNSLAFTWDGWSIAGPWGTNTSLKGDTLTVGYNTIMSLSDFEDAVYLRKRE